MYEVEDEIMESRWSIKEALLHHVLFQLGMLIFSLKFPHLVPYNDWLPMSLSVMLMKAIFAIFTICTRANRYKNLLNRLDISAKQPRHTLARNQKRRNITMWISIGSVVAFTFLVFYTLIAVGAGI